MSNLRNLVLPSKKSTVSSSNLKSSFTKVGKKTTSKSSGSSASSTSNSSSSSATSNSRSQKVAPPPASLKRKSTSATSSSSAPSSTQASLSNAKAPQRNSTKRAKAANKGVLTWVDKYAPQKESDLAVHKRKVGEVKLWLQASFESLAKPVFKRPFSPATSFPQDASENKILILTGPAGSGKSAVVNVFSKTFPFFISEWRESTSVTWADSDQKSISYTPKIEEFREFLLRAEKYRSLVLSNSEDQGNKVIVIEELPYLANNEQISKFRTIIREYLVKGKFPLIFILSDTYLGDSALVKVFSQEILDYPGIKTISFNPVAPKMMQKALTAIAATEKSSISTELIQSIADSSAGDMRHAINTLQFHCLKTSTTFCKSFGIKFTPSPPATKKRKPTPTNNDECRKDLAGCRDISYSLFHALGKMFYNKREDSDEILQSPTDRKKLVFDPEEVLEHVSIDPAMFNSFLHENYPMFFSDVEDIHSALDYLSIADTMTAKWEDYPTMQPFVSSLASRGLLYSNTHPIQPKWQPLYKPELLQTARTTEDNLRTIKELFLPVKSNSSTPLAQQIATAPSHTFRTETLPFLKKIANTTPNPYRKPANYAPLPLTASQKAFLQSLNSYQRSSYSKNANDKMDTESADFMKNTVDLGNDNEASVIANDDIDLIGAIPQIHFNENLILKNQMEQSNTQQVIPDEYVEDIDND